MRSNLLKHTVPFLFLLSISLVSLSQITYDGRIEIELKDGYSGETIFPFGENGFILRSVKEANNSGERQWRFERYDTQLDLMKTQLVMLHKKL